jgi:aspartyl-tRNA(Asn)/glutamyl-tRNA(Gln) amidotransferase subunit A
MKAPPPAARPTLAALAAGRTTSRKLVEDCLFRISHPDGEGKRIFVKVYDVAARIAAEAQDGYLP